MRATSKHLQIQGRSAKSIFILQMPRNIVSLFKRFGRRVFQNRTSSSCKPLAVIAPTDKHNRKMDNLISIVLGTPKHGWLPVDFHYKDFHLDFAASDVLNDPTEELFNAVTELQDNEVKRTTWWLEPASYFFDFERKGQSIVLTIIETDDLNDESAANRQLIKITGDNNEIFVPFRNALKQFSSQTYEENHWPYNLDKNKIKDL